MEHKNEIHVDVQQHADREEIWMLCCSSFHKVEIVFFTQIAFILLLSVFSMVQIVNKAPNSEIYFSILSTCIGIVIPSPSLQNTIEKNKT